MRVYGNSRIYLRQYYAYLPVKQEWYGGEVINLGGVSGPAPDGNYVQLWATGYLDASAVIATMTGSLDSSGGGGLSRGKVYIYAYSEPSLFSHMYVYVSETGSDDWINICDDYMTSDVPEWYYIGYASDFKYMAIACFNDNYGYNCNVMVDAVRVIPIPY
ncbi:MAG: hypothetical protein LBH74_09515 [Nitrososphaerota archaeon]|jgi:hypothetical protein|nr:hypothetical protein [Nitrososphaerota archaeon]